jgi:ATP/maltotriose-dependent transcriptional regulator MalT/DNA-binding MarR family transcriptional regulator
MTLAAFNLTIEDAVMLHLLDLTKFQDEFEVPLELTQPGIADAVGIRRSHVANVVKNLKEKGNVDDRTAHVKNQPRKRKIYFLTDNGKDYALQLRNKLEQKTVQIKNQKGKLEKVKMSEINKKHSTQISLLQLIRNVQPDKSIKLDHIFELDTKSQTQKSGTLTVDGPINFIETMAHPARFVGRNEELSNINEWINSELPRIIVITGIPGIGKTTLAAKVIEGFKDDKSRNLFWHRFHEWDTLRATLRDLSEFLHNLGRSKLKFYIDNQSAIELPEVMKILESDLQNLNMLLVFDDIQKISQDILQVFSMLVEILESDKYTEINIIILSRDAINFYDRRKVAIKNLVTEVELMGLDPNASKKLLNKIGIEDANLDKIYRVTQGHPLTLELINLHLSSQTAESRSKFDVDEFIKDNRDLNRYLRDEILPDLSEVQKKLLDLISVYRYPVSTEALLADSEIDHDCLDALVDKSLIQVSSSGYELHEFIKDFFNRRLNLKLKANYHIKAADFYASKLQETKTSRLPNAAIEAQHHYIQGGKFVKASELTERYGDELISKGYSEDLSGIIGELNPENLTENVWAKVLIHKGHISTVNGNWDDALDCYQHSLELCETLDDRQGLSRAYNGTGVIYFHKGNWQKAMELYEKGLEFAEAENDDQNCSKINSNISLIHWGNGDLDQAKELMRKSLFLSEKLDDLQGIARAYNNLGIIYWEQGELDEAITAYKKSLKISEDLEDKQTIAILLNNLGEAYRMKEMEKRAEEFYNKSLKLSQELGFKWQVGQVYCNLGELFKNSDKEKSMEYLNRSYEIYKYLGAKREVQKVGDLIASL